MLWCEADGGEGAVISAPATPGITLLWFGRAVKRHVYGEGLPLPETYDRPDPRIKQLARRSTVTPGGVACKYNDIIPADHCLHDVQEQSRLNHPKADCQRGSTEPWAGAAYRQKLLTVYTGDATAFCGSGLSWWFSVNKRSRWTYSDREWASENSTRWGVDKPLYKDLIGTNKKQH